MTSAPDKAPENPVAPRPGTCGEPTREGHPCGNYPIAGRGGKCYRHALGPTELQRWNAVKHGYFMTGFLTDEERTLYEQVKAGELPSSALKSQIVGSLAVRASRAVAWETEERAMNPLAVAAFSELRRALESFEPAEPEAKASVDAAEIHRLVQDAMRDKELLIRQFPPRVQEAIRAAHAKGAG